MLRKNTMPYYGWKTYCLAICFGEKVKLTLVNFPFVQPVLTSMQNRYVENIKP